MNFINHLPAQIKFCVDTVYGYYSNSLFLLVLVIWSPCSAFFLFGAFQRMLLMKS